MSRVLTTLFLCAHATAAHVSLGDNFGRGFMERTYQSYAILPMNATQLAEAARLHAAGTKHTVLSGHAAKKK